MERQHHPDGCQKHVNVEYCRCFMYDGEEKHCQGLKCSLLFMSTAGSPPYLFTRLYAVCKYGQSQGSTVPFRGYTVRLLMSPILCRSKSTNLNSSSRHLRPTNNRLQPSVINTYIHCNRQQDTMARGPIKHQKRLSAPSHWLLDKLSGAYAPRPSAGPHKLRDCMPLIIFIRNR